MKNYFWNEIPGVFVHKESGKIVKMPAGYDGPVWLGSDNEWVETLYETCIDVSQAASNEENLRERQAKLKLITNQMGSDKLKLSVMFLFGLNVIVDSAITNNIVNVFYDDKFEGTVTIQS